MIATVTEARVGFNMYNYFYLFTVLRMMTGEFSQKKVSTIRVLGGTCDTFDPIVCNKEMLNIFCLRFNN